MGAFQKEICGFKVARKIVSFRSPNKCPALEFPDSDGRIQSITTAVGDSTSFAYDPVLRRTTVTNPDGGVERTDLNADGDVIRKEDGRGRVTTFSYDANRNLATETNPAGETKTNTYDANGFRIGN